MSDRVVHIVGAGPAGLVAAINLARAGFEAIVYERNDDVGLRFNGDFQGLENWSTEEDVREFLGSIGVSINFRCEPYSSGEFYGPRLRKITIQTSRPLFYLLERGTNEWSLDQGLKRQALDEGVEFRWNDNVQKANLGTVIVGTGPKAADAIAKGVVFETSHPDACVGFMDDRIAPKAYAYLLVSGGKATFATCMFEDFQHERSYFVRALETMQRVVNIDIRQPREFGGYVNFFFRPSATKDGRILYVGENAGFQDALWGFGMRHAMFSGYLAAQSVVTGASYDYLCKRGLTPYLQASLANRWLFAHLGNYGYERFLSRIEKSDDVVAQLRKHYRPSWSKRMLFQVAKRWYHTRLVDKQCMHEHCDCIWCRHGKDAHQHEVDYASCELAGAK
ncbi:MAG: NAD(P)/FAD-dependent oxidoreductase [Candidatus Binatia bacterium]